MPREKFTFWRKFYISFESLSEQKRLEFITKLIQYALDDKEPCFKDKVSRALFENARPTIDNGKTRAAAGNAGGRASHGGGRPSEAKNKQKQANNKQKQAKNNPDTDTVTDTSSYIYRSDASGEGNSSGAGTPHLPDAEGLDSSTSLRCAQNDRTGVFAAVWSALEGAGVEVSDRVEEIEQYCARFGTDRTLDAIERAKQRGANTWAYVKAILDNAAAAPRPDASGSASQFQRHGAEISPMMQAAARRLLDQEAAGQETGE